MYHSILETIGQTPIIKINQIAPKEVSIYVKLESFNPSSSVKDRMAYAVICDAEQKGFLTKGQTVIEATSGNTGVALAMVCAAKGYPFVAVMNEGMSSERVQLIKAYGAKVILTPESEKTTGAVLHAKDLASKNNWFLVNQFDHLANPRIHQETTASEILLEFANKRLDYFVCGWGTGGTISGVGRSLKQARKDLKIVAVEPEEAPLLSGDDWQPHKIQGWVPNFTPKVLDESVVSQVQLVDYDEAKKAANLLAKKEGILCGISSGAAFAGALKLSKEVEANSVMLIVLPDTGERYLSTDLYQLEHHFE